MQAILAVLVVASYCMSFGEAQVPRVCSSIEILVSKTCCPTPESNSSYGSCGVNAGRGACTDVSEVCYTGYEEDPTSIETRLNWPTYFFTKICKCNGNYGGFDCSECEFGYTGDDCQTKLPIRTRKSVTAKTDEEWSTYNQQLRKVKKALSRYAIVLPTNLSDISTAIIRNISVYDHLVWSHVFAAKTHFDGYYADGSADDYAHESAGFPTWHRLLLLILEREFQIALDDPDFSLSYWDWTNFQGQPDWTSLLFSDDRLGGYNATGYLTGNYYDQENWLTICWPRPENFTEETCDPTDPLGIRAVIRCNNNTACTAEAGLFPTEADAYRALNNYPLWRDNTGAEPYAPFNKFARFSFGNYLEGFSVLPSSGEFNPLNSALANVSATESVLIGTLLHNIPHVILGLGSIAYPSKVQGTMVSEGASPNDPVFFNHHTMIDCLLDKYLKNTTEGYVGPIGNRLFAGHGPNDCLVPFFPLYTHVDMHKVGSEFGFQCDLRNFTAPNSTPPQPDGAMQQIAQYNVLLAALVVFAFAYILF